MGNYSKAEILRIVEDEDVEFIRLQFTDMFGNLKNIAIPASRLIKAMENRCTIDMASLEGFDRGEETDLYLKPDLNTFNILPWRPQQGKVARLLCDVCMENGEEYAASPRQILKRAVKRAENHGYTFQLNPECEFFLFHTDEDGLPTTLTHEQGGYFDVGPLDFGENARRDMVLTLEEMGFVIESSYHETAPAQHEIDFKYDEALATADNIMTFKLAVKTIAKRHGLHATFMPKPKYGVDGSGMHLHMSLLQDGNNIFADESGILGLSKDALYFIGGLLKHAKGMTAVTNPIVNSYKRLVPGFEAPAYIAWSATNRSTLIRIPAAAGDAVRMELRNPDPTANPYLALAAVLRAGLDGIKRQTSVPESVDCNIFHMSEQERRVRKIEELPGTLAEAISCMEKDRFMRETLGDHVFEKYISLKKEEWNRYRSQVTDWEISEYLNRF